jgi:hypothetical protein
MLQSFAANNDPLPNTSSVIITEINDELMDNTTPAPLADENMEFSFQPAEFNDTVLENSNSLPSIDNNLASPGFFSTDDSTEGSMQITADVLANDIPELVTDQVALSTTAHDAPLTIADAMPEADSSRAHSQDVVIIQGPQAPVRARGRPRKAATPRVENFVRRSTRLHNDGVHVELPNQPTRRRASSVPRASPPAILQIAEMQRLGVERCLIDPAELAEERLLQERQD